MNGEVEVFSRGHGAWIVRQNDRLFTTETWSCERFVPLAAKSSEGLDVPVGCFEMRKDILVFAPAAKSPG